MGNSAAAANEATAANATTQSEHNQNHHIANRASIISIEKYNRPPPTGARGSGSGSGSGSRLNSLRPPLEEDNNMAGLNENDVRLVRNSWKEMQQANDLKNYVKYLWKFAAALQTEEEMRQSAQLKSHGKNVFEAINAAVNSLDKLDALNASLGELGSRHQTYGARCEHFPYICEALLETIADALNPNFTQQHRASWEKIIKYFEMQMSKHMT